jgi:hypothetical protein
LSRSYGDCLSSVCDARAFLPWLLLLLLLLQINDRYEFFDELDLDRGDGKYLSPQVSWRMSTTAIGIQSFQHATAYVLKLQFDCKCLSPQVELFERLAVVSGVCMYDSAAAPDASDDG